MNLRAVILAASTSKVAGVLISPFDPQSPPLQTSSGWGASLIWLPLPKWSLSLEGGIVKGKSGAAGDRDVITDFVVNPATFELDPVIESFSGEVSFSNRLSWIAVWIGRRGRVLDGLEGWIEAGPVFAKSTLRADFLGSFQGPQSPYDAQAGRAQLSP